MNLFGKLRQVDAVVVNDRIGAVAPLQSSCLLSDDVQHRALAPTGPRHDPRDLGGLSAIDHPDSIHHARPASRLDQQRYIEHCHVGFRSACPSLRFGRDHRMEDGLQSHASRDIRKDKLTHSRAIESTFAINDVRTERRSDRSQSLPVCSRELSC